MQINGGELYTNDPLVEVSVPLADAADEMLVSESGSQPLRLAFRSTFPWRLEAARGKARRRSIEVAIPGGRSLGQASIMLDQAPPRVKTARFRRGMVTIDASDVGSGLASMQLSRRPGGGRLRAFSDAVRAGTRSSVYLRVFDAAGNGSRWVKARRS